MKRRILLYGLGAVLFLFLLFQIFFVLPSPLYYGDEVPIPASPSPRKVALRLLPLLSRSGELCPAEREPWVRPDLWEGGCQVSLGKYLWMVETRRALPAEGIREMTLEVAPGSELSFAMGCDRGEADFKLSVNGKAVLERRLSPAPDRSGLWFREVGKFFFHRFFPQRGYWSDANLSLAPWAGQRVTLRWEGKGGYWAEPVVTVPKEGKPPLNIVLIQVDSLRSDLVEEGALENIERLRRKGGSFPRAYATGNWTRSSNYAELFGLRSPQVGISNYDFYIHPLEKLLFYRRRLPSLPTLFRQAGYATAAIGDNIFLHGFSEWSVDVGFDQVKDYEKLRQESVYITDDVLRWVQEKRGRPFFLFVDFNQTHTPYKPPVTALRPGDLAYGWSQGLYRACNRYVDRFVGRLVESLEKAGYGENTLFVIHADHGESFANFGRVRRGWQGDKDQVVAHGHSLYREEIAVPLIFYGPGRVKPGRHWTRASLIDIPRTVLSMAGIAIPEGWQGRDLSPLLKGERAALPEVPLIVEGRDEAALIDGPWLYLTSLTRPETEELYDLVKDPSNKKDLSRREWSLRSRLRERLETLFPPSAPLLVAEFNVPQGQTGRLLFPSSSRPLLWGSLSGSVGKDGEAFLLQGQGRLYLLFSSLPSRARLLAPLPLLTPWGFPAEAEGVDGGTELSLDRGGGFPFWAPFQRSLSSPVPVGVTLSVTPLLRFVKEDAFNPVGGAGESMKEIMVQWGYMK